MIDLDREFEILQEWINYRVDWYATYLTEGRLFYIDIDCIPTNWTPEKIFEVYKQMGVMYYQPEPKVCRHECLTFAEFKKYNNYE